MDNLENVIGDYLKITGGFTQDVYLGPEEQAKRIVKCSILKDVNLEYQSFTNIPPISSET